MFKKLQLLKNHLITLKQFFDGYKVDLPIVNKIAIIQFRALGDAILLSGFIREVKLNNSDKDLVIICDKNNYPIFEYCPYASEVIALDINTNNLYQCIEDILYILPKYFFKYRFNKIFCMQIGVNNLYSMVCANLVGAQEIIGFGANVQQMYLQNEITPTDYDFLLTNNMLHPKDMWNDVERKYYLLEILGYKIHSHELEMWIDDYYDLSNIKKPIAIGLGGREKKKKYDIHLLIDALKQIYLIDPSVTFILLGGKDDTPNIKMDWIDLTGKISIRQSAYIIKNSFCYIGNDTATLHIASIYKKPIIALYMEAKDKTQDNPGLLSSIYRFAPKNIKILQPKTSLYPCNQQHVHGGCSSTISHCINQIKPIEIVNAYKEVNIRAI